MFSVYAQIKYCKSVWGVVKSFIEKNSWAGLEDFFSALIYALQQEYCLPTVKPRSLRKKVRGNWHMLIINIQKSFIHHFLHMTHDVHVLSSNQLEFRVLHRKLVLKLNACARRNGTFHPEDLRKQLSRRVSCGQQNRQFYPTNTFVRPFLPFQYWSCLILFCCSNFGAVPVTQSA